MDNTESKKKIIKVDIRKLPERKANIPSIVVTIVLTVLLAAGAREDEAFIRGLDPADAFILGRAIFEANKDFFTKKAALLLPKRKKKAGK